MGKRPSAPGATTGPPAKKSRVRPPLNTLHTYFSQRTAPARVGTQPSAPYLQGLNARQADALKAVVDEGVSLFFTGSAGTGKSYVLHRMVAALQNKFKADSNPWAVAITASTGLAASAVGGHTLHSWAGIPISPETQVDAAVRHARLCRASNRLKGARALIIEEISMVDGRLFQLVSEVLRRIRKQNCPFGGLQVILCGDFYQLPPVHKGIGDQALFAFQVPAWGIVERVVRLTEVFRQTDPAFVAILDALREAKVTSAVDQAIRALQRPLPPASVQPARLYPLRNSVEKANNRELRRLPGAPFSFDAIDSGPAKNYQVLLDASPASPVLTLKVGAQVMLLKNFDNGLVNGTLGTVEAFMTPKAFEREYSPPSDDQENLTPQDSESGAMDALLCRPDSIGRPLNGRNSQERFPVVAFSITTGSASDVVRRVLVMREEFRLDGPDGLQLARRVQIPLALAWALTIHKSQGKTISRLQVDVGDCFAHGQVYVALSRAQSMDSLQVIGFNASKVHAHPAVVAWTDSLDEA